MDGARLPSLRQRTRTRTTQLRTAAVKQAETQRRLEDFLKVRHDQRLRLFALVTGCSQLCITFGIFVFGLGFSIKVWWVQSFGIFFIVSGVMGMSLCPPDETDTDKYFHSFPKMRVVLAITLM